MADFSKPGPATPVTDNAIVTQGPDRGGHGEEYGAMILTDGKQLR
jgi:hypothetical protein